MRFEDVERDFALSLINGESTLEKIDYVIFETKGFNELIPVENNRYTKSGELELPADETIKQSAYDKDGCLLFELSHNFDGGGTVVFYLDEVIRVIS